MECNSTIEDMTKKKKKEEAMFQPWQINNEESNAWLHLPKAWVLKLVLYDCLKTVKLGLELVNHQANSRVTISLCSTQPLNRTSRSMG